MALLMCEDWPHFHSRARISSDPNHASISLRLGFCVLKNSCLHETRSSPVHRSFVKNTALPFVCASEMPVTWQPDVAAFNWCFTHFRSSESVCGLVKCLEQDFFSVFVCSVSLTVHQKLYCPSDKMARKLAHVTDPINSHHFRTRKEFPSLYETRSFDQPLRALSFSRGVDFWTLICRYITIILEVTGNNDVLGNITGLRTFRVLRALKTVSIVPGEASVTPEASGVGFVLVNVIWHNDTKYKNSSMELAVIWGNLACSDLARSDLACFFCQNSYFFHLIFTTWELI